MKKVLVILIIVLLLGAGGYLVYTKQNANNEPKPNNEPTTTTKVEQNTNSKDIKNLNFNAEANFTKLDLKELQEGLNINDSKIKLSEQGQAVTYTFTKGSFTTSNTIENVKKVKYFTNDKETAIFFFKNDNMVNVLAYSNTKQSYTAEDIKTMIAKQLYKEIYRVEASGMSLYIGKVDYNENNYSYFTAVKIENNNIYYPDDFLANNKANIHELKSSYIINDQGEFYIRTMIKENSRLMYKKSPYTYKHGIYSTNSNQTLLITIDKDNYAYEFDITNENIPLKRINDNPIKDLTYDEANNKLVITFTDNQTYEKNTSIIFR